MLVVPFIYFTCLSLFLWQRHKRFEVSAFLAALYAFSALCSIPTYVKELREWSIILPHLHVLPTIVYCLLITISILPFSLFHCEQIKEIGKPKMWLFDTLSWIFIVTFWITFINLLPDIKQSFIDGDWAVLRSSIYGDNTPRYTGIRYYLAIPETIFSPCAPIALLFYFYSSCFLKKSPVFNALLLLSSATPILPAILIAGRTQIIYWILIFIICYLFFKPFLPEKQKRIIRITFIVIISIAVLFMSIVAISRWGEKGSVTDMILLYAGEPYLFFCRFFDDFHFTELHLQRLLPFTHYFILGKNIDLNAYRDLIYSQSGMEITIFYTFLGDMMVDLGKIGMCIYLLFFVGATSLALHHKKDEKLPFYKLLLFIICILVPAEGVFYYSFHTVRMSYYIIQTALYAFLFKYRFKLK